MRDEKFSVRNDQIRKLSAQGVSHAVIAARYGLHATRINQIVNRSDPVWFANYRSLATARSRKYKAVKRERSATR